MKKLLIAVLSLTVAFAVATSASAVESRTPLLSTLWKLNWAKNDRKRKKGTAFAVPFFNIFCYNEIKRFSDGYYW